jgi:dienelactone hydrolase
MRPRSRRVLLLVLLGGLLLAAVLAVPHFLRGLSLVARAADMKGGLAGRIAWWGTGPFSIEETQVPSRHGPLRTRVFRPEHPRGRTVLLIPGVHAGGIDEPRLVELARDLAAGGLTVLTPELPDLLLYRITPREPDMIEDAALWASARPELAPDGRVGLMGISFSGGLSVVAAGRPSLADKVAFTFSLGGHGDLSRVLAFLCTGVQPDGRSRKPHDYGLAVILLNVAARVVPPEQVEALRAGILTFLRASHFAMHDARRANEIFAEARRMQSEMPEPAATFMKYVNERDVATLGPLLLPHTRAFASDPSLSPERSPAPPTPVYLLHGTDDTIIPAVESVLLARWLEPRTRVRLLLTPLITHAELDRKARALEVWRLSAFWAALLDV